MKPKSKQRREVKRFRCTASRFRLDDPPRNPFLMRLENIGPGKTTTREFEFDAADEAECRRLFKEAQEQGVSNVVGFTLDSVEQIRICKACECPIDEDGCGCNPHDA